MSEKKTYENDYSLLRAFDLKAARAGAKVVETSSDFYQGDIGEYVAGPNKAGDLVFNFESLGFMTYQPGNRSGLRMVPLRWVEGKPLYPGDELFYREGYEQGRFIAKRAHADESRVYGFTYFDNGRTYEDELSCEIIHALTWEKPKPKQNDGWITWSGGERPGDRPVAEDVLVEVKFRCGDVKKGLACTWYACWRNDKHQGDIVAYRVVDQPKPAPKPVKRWINVYADNYGDLLHETKKAADASASYDCIACIEIELPPLAEVAK